MVAAELDALLQLFPKTLPKITLKEGEDIDFSSLPFRLTQMGYVRGFEVETKGAFALRGDILDIYPVNAENPVRVDFFGDTVEKIKPYDIVTGERLAGTREISVYSASHGKRDGFFLRSSRKRRFDFRRVQDFMG